MKNGKYLLKQFSMQFDWSAYFLLKLMTQQFVFPWIFCHLNFISIIGGCLYTLIKMLTNCTNVYAAAHKETCDRNHWRSICKAHIGLDDVSRIPAHNTFGTKWQNQTVCRQPCWCIIISNSQGVYWGHERY